MRPLAVRRSPAAISSSRTRSKLALPIAIASDEVWTKYLPRRNAKGGGAADSDHEDGLRARVALQSTLESGPEDH